MTPRASVPCLLMLIGLGCRPDATPDPTPTVEEARDQSTGVGNPGNMTVRSGPVTGLDLTSVVLPVASVQLQLCDGTLRDAVVESGAVRLDADASVPLPLLTETEQAAGVCGVGLTPAGPLTVRGAVAELDATFSADIELAALDVPLDAALAVTEDTLLAMVLGSSGWLDADWIGLEPGTHVHLDLHHPQHDAIAERLALVAVESGDSGTPLGTVDGSPTPPAMHVAVGAGGWMVGSWSDGREWSELRPAVGGDAELDLFAAAVSGDGAMLVAVGGDTEGTVVVTEDAERFTEVVAPTFGLRDVVWTGTRFLAVGVEGRVAWSTDGLSWTGLDPLGDCHFSAVAVSEGTILAVGDNDGFGGCAWASTDDAASFQEKAAPSSAALDIHATDGGFVVVGEGGKLSWTLDGGGAWSAVVLDDTYLHDVIVWDGWVKVLGDAGTWYTRDYFEIFEGETAGFTRWVPDLRSETLLAVTEDGEVYRPLADDTLSLTDWERIGDFGRSETGAHFWDLVVWTR